MRKFFTHYHTLNKVGLWLSVLCMIHCLAMPFVITALPFLSKSLISEQTEKLLIGASAVLAIILLRKDYKNHQNIIPFVLLAVALCFNFAGIFWAKEGVQETLLNVTGALLMATAYYSNWYYHRKTCHSHQH